MKVDDESTRVKALDRGPEFTVCRVSGSKPCVFVDNCARGRRGTTRRGREVFVEKVGVVAGEFRVVMEDVDELASDKVSAWLDGGQAGLGAHLDV